MPEPSNNLSDRELRLGAAVVDCLQAVEAGQPAGDLLARFPEFAAELEEFIHERNAFERLVTPLRSATAAGDVQPNPLGDFRIVGELGRGGMAIVYEAEQMSLGRRVALKVLPFAATLDPRHRQRFLNEARAAATLDHPHIVPILSVGCERGVHYYAMKLIDGQSLAEVIAHFRHESGRDTKPVGRIANPSEAGQPSQPASESRVGEVGRIGNPSYSTPPPSATEPSGVDTIPTNAAASTLGPRQDRSFFKNVAEHGMHAAEALEHAHQAGIVHRDIKPANLLLDVHGKIWVADFGLAHVHGGPELTRTGDLLGTLRYMSPEQAFTRPTDHRADIYSLGLSLYELLTLTPAFPDSKREELLRHIADDEPKPPRAFDKAIPPELDTIVRKAIAKSPAERYATAQEMADDLRRYLEDKPIVARPPTIAQHVRRWYRRHKALVTTVVICVLVAVAGLAAGIGWISGEHTARLHATDERVARAFQEARCLQDQERWFEARTAIDRACDLLAGGSAKYHNSVRQTAADLDMVIRLEDIRLQTSGGDKHGRFDISSRDSAYRQAFAEYKIDTARAREAAETIAAKSIRVPFAAALDDWAIVCRSTRPKDDRAWRDLLAIARVADPDPLRNQVRDALQREDRQALQELIASYHAADLPASTLLLIVRILRDSRFLGEPKPQGGSRPRGESSSPGGSINVLRKAIHKHPHSFWLNEELAWHLAHATPPQWDEAIRLYSVARALRPQSPGAQVALSFALLGSGRFDDAMACCEEALRLNPALGSAHNNLGVALAGQKQWHEAIACYREAIRLGPADFRAHANLGTALAASGHWDDAVASFREALRLEPGLAEVHSSLGMGLVSRGRLDEGIDCLREALRLEPDLAAAHAHLGAALQKKGLREEALTPLKEAARLQPADADSQTRLAVALRDLGRLPEAIIAFQQAVRLQPDKAAAHSNLGVALMGAGRFPEAIAAHRQAIALDPKSAVAHSNLGAALRRNGRFQEAINAYQRASAVDARFAGAYSNLAWLLATVPDEKLRDPARAVAAAKKAVQLKPRLATSWQRLGVSQYRAGNIKAAVLALHKSIDLGKGDNVDWCFLAMAHWKLGDRKEAEKWFRQATGSMAKNDPRRQYQPSAEEIRRFRAEAAKLLGME